MSGRKLAFVLNTGSICLIYLFLILLLTFPAIIKLDTSVPGYSYTDTWNALWGIDFVKDCFAKGKSIFFTDDIFYPGGGYFYPINWLNGVLILPIHLFFSLPITYSLLIIVLLLIAAVGMHRLIFYITQNKSAAFYSGVCYVISPLVITTIHNGNDENLGLCWIPYYILCLMKVFNGDKPKSLIPSVIFLCLTILSSWYIGFSIVLFTVLFLAYKLIILKDKEIKKVIIKKTAVILVVSALITLPFFALFYRSIVSDKRIGANLKSREDVSYLLNNIISVNLSDYFRIQPRNFKNRMDDSQTYPELKKCYVHGVYVGYIALFLSLYGLLRGKRYSYKTFWLFCIVFFFLLSLGMLPDADTSRIEIKILKKVLPFSIINYIVPVSSFATLTFRFVIIMYISLFTLAAIGLVSLLNRIQMKYSFPITVFISSCTVFEYLALAPVPYPLKYSPATVPDFVLELAKQPGTAIIEFPYNHTMCRSLHPGIYYQRYHKKKVFYGLNITNNIPAALKGNIFLKYLELIYTSDAFSESFNGNDMIQLQSRINIFDYNISDELRMIFKDGAAKFPARIKESIEQLKDFSFSHLVIYKDMMPSSAQQRLAYFLKPYLGRPSWESEKVAIYKL